MSRSRPAKIRGLVAFCTAALWVSGPSFAQFIDVSAGSGLPSGGGSPFTLGVGSCAEDFDGDGDPDLIVSQGPGSPYRYFRNDGGMVFTERSAASGLGISAFVRGMVAGDVDNDGDADLFCATNGVPLQLFINDGSGVFAEEGLLRGLTLSQQAWAGTFGDFDRDGWLDLYVGVRTDLMGNFYPNVLYRNLGNGFFATMPTAGVGELGLTLATSWFDYDEDGWPDLVCANDKGTSQPPNATYRNNGNGTFTSTANLINAAQGVCGMGVDHRDAFNDGGVDLMITDSIPDHLFLVWDPATSSYVARQSLLSPVQTIGWACQFLDYDNDGFADIHAVESLSRNRLWRNPGSPVTAAAPWVDVLVVAPGVPTFFQYTSIAADFDQDGRVDLLHMRADNLGLVLQRNVTTSGNWLAISLQGRVSNRDGQGAVVRVTANGSTQTQQVRSGVGYISSPPRQLHYGLGNSPSVDVEIRWPSGRIQRLLGVPGNQSVVIREPNLSLTSPPTVGTTTSLALDVQGDAGLPFLMTLGSSASPGLVLPSGRTVPILWDPLSQSLAQPGNGVLLTPAGTVPANGLALSLVAVPNIPALSGLTMFAAGITLDAGSPDGVRSILGSGPLTIP